VRADDEVRLDPALAVRADVALVHVAPEVLLLELALVALGQRLARPEDEVQDDTGEGQQRGQQDGQHLHQHVLAAVVDVAVCPEHGGGPEQDDIRPQQPAERRQDRDEVGDQATDIQWRWSFCGWLR
jgi:hypothetical protein